MGKSVKKMYREEGYNMMGILTFHRAHNYGSVLQAYALQNWLFNNGTNNEIIDYYPTSSRNLYRILPKIHRHSDIKK